MLARTERSPKGSVNIRSGRRIQRRQWVCSVSCNTVQPIRAGEKLSMDNIWVKRPGTGALLARDFPNVLGRTAQRDLPANVQLQPSDYE